MGSGVAGIGRSLDFSLNPYNSPAAGPLASTVANPALNFGLLNSFTVTFWVMPDSDFFTSSPNSASLNNQRLLILSPTNVTDYPTTPASVPGLFMKVNSYDTQAENGQLKVFFNSAEYVTPTGSFASAAGQWSFVAITYDGAALKVYSATQTNAPSSPILTAANAGQALNFATNGNLLLCNRGDLAKSMDGWMADFRLYSGAGGTNFLDHVRRLAASPPSGLSATSAAGQTTLNWTAYEGAASYNIRRSSASGGPYSVISPPGNVTGTTFADSSAATNTAYYYVVSATTPYGESGNSSEVSSASGCTPPAAPTASYNSPLYAQMTLYLAASTIPGATYNWTGPNGFGSLSQNPSIVGVGPEASGTYSVTATLGGCTSAPGTTTVTVNPSVAVAVQASAGAFIFTWPYGTLESATNVVGPWSPVAGATSPYTNASSQPQQFFQIKVQ